MPSHQRSAFCRDDEVEADFRLAFSKVRLFDIIVGGRIFSGKMNKDKLSVLSCR
jgi:hypothetical protein